jgi:hypothetical protein
MRANLMALLAMAGLAGGALRALQAQSLADVAKKEEERRQQLPRPGKVYTNKDLGSAPPPSATPPPEAAPQTGGAADPGKAEAGKTEAGKAAGAKTGPGKADDKTGAKDQSADAKEKPKDQDYWAARLKGLREALDHDTSFADALQSKINALATDFVNRDDPAQRAVIERNRQKALAELDQVKKQVVADRKAIADFEEEARRAGVPPGWLR